MGTSSRIDRTVFWDCTRRSLLITKALTVPNMKRTVLLLLAVLSCAGLAPAASASRLSASIQTIRAVGPEGGGNAEAARAWKELGAGDAGSLLIILGGMDGANDLAVNWLRAA